MVKKATTTKSNLSNETVKIISGHMGIELETTTQAPFTRVPINGAISRHQEPTP